MSIKINAPEQQKEVLAFCVVGRGGSAYTWSIGKYPNIIHATKAVRKAINNNLVLILRIS